MRDVIKHINCFEVDCFAWENKGRHYFRKRVRRSDTRPASSKKINITKVKIKQQKTKLAGENWKFLKSCDVMSTRVNHPQKEWG